MTEKDIVEAIAAPIVQKLLQMEPALTKGDIRCIPQVHLVRESFSDDFASHINSSADEFSDELLAKVESYIQDELEKSLPPLILH
jgi:hypothetical protein